MNDEQTNPQPQESYTIEDYLRGVVNVGISDAALKSICKRLGITPGTEYDELSEKQVDLSTAWLYVWLSGSPTTSSKISDKDGDWSHSEGGETMSANVLKGYLRMANELFAKWDEPAVGKDKWGMICNGFHDIRNYGGKRGRRIG
jgi:hypothetical protein